MEFARQADNGVDHFDDKQGMITLKELGRVEELVFERCGKGGWE